MPPYTYSHPHPAVAVDVVVLALRNDVLEVLLIERARDPYAGRWALPGGFVGIDEDLADAARRELREETSLAAGPLQQIGAFGAPQRDPRERVISVAFWTRLDSAQPARAGSDARTAAWFPVDRLPPLAFDHGQIVAAALRAAGNLRRP
ncbi:MAG: NUDIX hydrolase [Pseudomonadales bacterium]